VFAVEEVEYGGHDPTPLFDQRATRLQMIISGVFPGSAKWLLQRKRWFRRDPSVKITSRARKVSVGLFGSAVVRFASNNSFEPACHRRIFAKSKRALAECSLFYCP
jgi:hypothetical protein